MEEIYRLKYKLPLIFCNQHPLKMSIIASNCDQICKSPLNNSTAKMLYSFSKESRFPKKKQILCDKFYNLKSTLHLRTTSFGIGDKYDFTRDASCSPPPNTYNLKDTFRKNTQKVFGFGKGRDQMQVTGPFVDAKRNKNPGPDSYTLPSMLEKKSFNFRSKLKTFDDSKKLVPGPGAYPVTFTINERGRYFLTKYKTVCARDFSKYIGRCQTSQQKFPGPGAYSVQGIDISPKGKYVSSRLNNCLVRSFEGSERRFLGDKSNTPGPGNYRLPSEFGYYDSSRVMLKGKGTTKRMEHQETINASRKKENSPQYVKGKQNKKMSQELKMKEKSQGELAPKQPLVKNDASQEELQKKQEAN